MQSIVSNLLHSTDGRRPAPKLKCLVFWVDEAKTSIIDLDAVNVKEDREEGKTTKCRWAKGKHYDATIVAISDSLDLLEKKQREVTEELHRQLTEKKNAKGNSESRKKKNGTTTANDIEMSNDLENQMKSTSSTTTLSNAPTKSKRRNKENEIEDGHVSESKKKKLQKDAALTEINKLIGELDNTSEKKEDVDVDPMKKLQPEVHRELDSTSSILETANDVLFSPFELERENVADSSQCCPHCVNLHVRVDTLEEELKKLKQDLCQISTQTKDQEHTAQHITQTQDIYNNSQFTQQYSEYTQSAPQQPYLQQSYIPLQQTVPHSHQQFSQSHQQFTQLQQPFTQSQQPFPQSQQFTQSQQPFTLTPSQHPSETLPCQVQDEHQQDQQLFNGFTKEQLMRKIKNLAFSKACKVLFRMMFAVEEREGHSVTGGCPGKPALNKQKLQQLYDFLGHQFPHSTQQNVNVKLAEVLKPSATPKKSEK